MEVYACGYNNFNQLNYAPLKLNSDVITIKETEGKSDIKKSHANPISLFSTKQCTAENLNIFFTWSRCIVSIKAEDGKYYTFVAGFSKKEENSTLFLENSLCTAVTESSIILREKDAPERISALCNEVFQPVSVSIRSDENQTSCVKLHQLSGGHKDFYSVYDGINFGKFRLPDIPSDSETHKKKSSEVMDIRISHIDSIISIKEISCGKEHVLLLATSGNVYSYGLSSRGQLGHGEVENESSPRLIDALDGLPIKTIASGGWHSTAVSEIGDLYVWGWNESGQLGLVSVKKEDKANSKVQDDNIGIVATPVCNDIPDGENVKGVACGSRHTVVLTETGKIFTCGWNGYGQLGFGDFTSRATLTRVDGFTACRVFAGHWNSAFVCKKD